RSSFVLPSCGKNTLSGLVTVTSRPPSSSTASFLLMPGSWLGGKRRRPLEHALVELLEAPGEHTEVETLQDQPLAGFSQAAANLRVPQQVHDALCQTRHVAVGHDQARLAVRQGQFDVLGIEGNHRLAEAQRLQDGDADEA